MTLPAEIQTIKDRWSKATKGPWQWSGYVSKDNLKQTDINLMTTWGGRRVVMMFERVGFRDAQPWFQPQPGDLGMQQGRDLVKQDPETSSGQFWGINHPDAEAIAHAPEDVRVLLETVHNLYASALMHRELLNSALTALQNTGTPEALAEVQTIQDLAGMMFMPKTSEDA